MTACTECGTSFKVSSPRNRGTYKFCSRECNRKWHYKSTKSKRVRSPLRHVECGMCLSEFETRSPQKKYCSPRCLTKVNNLRGFGLTPSSYREMIERHEGDCGICGEPFEDSKSLSMVVEHCHTSGEVRSLAHSNCNLAVGQISESLAKAQGIVRYLAKHQFDIRDYCVR